MPPKSIPLSPIEVQLVSPLLMQLAQAKLRLGEILAVVQGRSGVEGVKYAFDWATKSLIPLNNGSDVTVTSALGLGGATGASTPKEARASLDIYSKASLHKNGRKKRTK